MKKKWRLRWIFNIFKADFPFFAIMLHLLEYIMKSKNAIEYFSSKIMDIAVLKATK